MGRPLRGRGNGAGGPEWGAGVGLGGLGYRLELSAHDQQQQSGVWGGGGVAMLLVPHPVVCAAPARPFWLACRPWLLRPYGSTHLAACWCRCRRCCCLLHASIDRPASPGGRCATIRRRPRCCTSATMMACTTTGDSKRGWGVEAPGAGVGRQRLHIAPCYRSCSGQPMRA